MWLLVIVVDRAYKLALKRRKTEVAAAAAEDQQKQNTIINIYV